MITFQKLRWKNFLSTGNSFTEIDFTRNPTTLIVGENSSGKSTCLDVLCFGLFNKPFRNINKPQLVNSINGKRMLVEIEFGVGKKQYKVIRGMKLTCLKSTAMISSLIRMLLLVTHRNIWKTVS